MSNLFIKILSPILILFSGFSPSQPIPAQPSTRLDVTHLEQSISNLDVRLKYIENHQSTSLGATLPIPTSVALFETSLASKITSSATSMTLVSGTDKTGTALASSTYAFIIDEGSATEEMVLADCTSTACTNMTRGISPITGTTTVVALEHEHRRGASVKITDGPQLVLISRILNGYGSFPNLLNYTYAPSYVGASTTALVSYGLLQQTSFAGTVNADEATKGIIELATQSEMAASTALGATGASVVIQAKYSSSSPFVTSGSYVPVTRSSDNKISPNFIATTTADTYNFGAKINFNANASTTGLSSGYGYFGGTATTSISSAGVLTLATTTAGCLQDDATGVVFSNRSSCQKQQYTYASTTASTFGAGVVFTSSTVSIPASTLTASSSVTIKGTYICVSGGSNANNCTLDVVDNSGNVYVTYTLSTATTQTDTIMFDATVLASNSTSAQRGVLQGTGKVNNAYLPPFTNGGTASIDWTAARTFGVKLTTSAGTGNTGTLNSFSIIVNP